MKTCQISLRRLCLLSLSTLALSLSGCGGHSEMKLSGDVMGAGGFLVQALEAWKTGETPESLLKSIPPVRVVDEDWNAGRKLESYEVVGNPVENGSHWRVYAQLKTQAADGKSVSEKVCYAVTLAEPASILRSDFLD